MSQLAYRGKSAAQRKALRDQALDNAARHFGIAEYMGNEEFLRLVGFKVLDRDKHGATIRVTGPAATADVRFWFTTGRLVNSPVFLYLFTLTPHAELRKCLGFSTDFDSAYVWEYMAEGLALEDEKVQQFLNGSVASVKDVYLFRGDVLARLRENEEGYSVEYKVAGHPVTTVSSIEHFLKVYVGPYGTE